MRRAMLVLNGAGPYDYSARFDHFGDTQSSYDHPYFGQIFLAAVLGAIGYPGSFGLSADPSIHSIEMLYLVPRVLMGLLAILDTFLVYKIAEWRYNRNVALIASIAFAVMPATWLLRRIYLDSIMLPFLLSSVLLAVYTKPAKEIDTSDRTNSSAHPQHGRIINTNIAIMLSGVLLGLAIYTKIPAFTMIPLIGFLIHQNNKSLRKLGLWFIPVVLIPLMWPVYSMSVGQFDEWMEGFIHQTQRSGSTLLDSMMTLYRIDPVIVSLGLAGLVFAIIKKDFFSLLWILPFILLSVAIGFVQYFHLLILLPGLCFATGRIMEGLPKMIIRNKMLQNWSTLSSIAALGIFGLASTSLLIWSNVNSSYFETYAFVVQHLPHSGNADNNNGRATIITDHWWGLNIFWIPAYVLGEDHDLRLDSTPSNIPKIPVKTDKVLMLLDPNLKERISLNSGHDKYFESLQVLYNNSKTIAILGDNGTQFSAQGYPFTSMAAMIENEHRPLGKLEVRTNY